MNARFPSTSKCCLSAVGKCSGTTLKCAIIAPARTLTPFTCLAKQSLNPMNLQSPTWTMALVSKRLSFLQMCSKLTVYICILEIDFKDQVEKCLNMAPSYSTVVSYTQTAQALWDQARENIHSCEKLVHDQHLQQQVLVLFEIVIKEITLVQKIHNNCN